MKTANAAPSSANSHRRAQPVRQTRVNPPRASGANPRAGPGARSSQAGQETQNLPTYPPVYFPAITHFTDSITALPKEVVRHFSLLKEVDAKACGPEETLSQLTDLALRTPNSSRRVSNTNDDDHGESNGRVVVAGNSAATAEGAESANDPPASDANGFNVDEASDTTRRHIFLNLRYVLSEMLMTLDEKNHVLSTANDALGKELKRMDSSYPYIENEVSEEARLGSLRHWAYNDKNGGRSNGAVAGSTDRGRRDVIAANSLAAAAAAINEEATANRGDRREAKRSRKQQLADSDFDEDHHGRHGPTANAGQGPKKSHAKVRKPVDTGAVGTGLGITNGQTALGNPPTKRRKTEKAANGDAIGSVAMERSISSAMGNHGVGGKGKAGSPRETPALDGGRKRARAGGAAGGAGAVPATAARKRNPTTAAAMQSPSLASSPVQPAFTASREHPHGSPVPNASHRPQSSRARKNSSHSLSQDPSASHARQRSFSSSSNKPQGSNGASTIPTELANLAGSTTVPDAKASTKEPLHSKVEHSIEDPAHDGHAGETKGALLIGTNGSNKTKEGLSVLKREESTANSASGDHDPAAHGIRTTTLTTNTRKASKTSTPVTATFSDSHRSRPRPSRAQAAPTEKAIALKRSHKKGAGAAAAAAQQRYHQHAGGSSLGSGAQDDEEDSVQGDDDDEEDLSGQRYCYCKQVSYGEMVACDADDCKIEWFHLGCVGLLKAPTKNAKWYCDECKKNLNKGKFPSNGGSGGAR